MRDASRVKEKTDAMRDDRQQKKAAMHRFFRYFFAYVKKNPYLCRRNWRLMTALLRNLYNCLNSSSPHRKQPAAWFTPGTPDNENIKSR